MVALIIVLTILVVGWLTAAATVVRSVSHIWLRRWVEQQLAGVPVPDAVLQRPHRQALSAGMGSMLAVALAGALIAAARGGEPWWLGVDAIVLVLGLLLFGQLLPRAIARHSAPRLARVVLPPLQALAVVLAPLLWLARMAARAVAPREGAVPPSAHQGIEDLLREGELEGIGEAAEIEIITGVVQFGEKVLRDVMTPRTNVFAVDEAMAPRAMARAIAQSGYSRVPVYRGSLDEIIGIVHVFDVLQEGGEHRPRIRPVAHAPATKRCSEMLFEMLRGQNHMAVVLDEFGGTAGIVTLEDVLEELVGDIRDEHDEPAPLALPQTPRAVLVEGSTPLGDVGERFGTVLPAEAGDRTQTLGGLVVRLLGRIPALGERFRLGDLELTVVEAEPARVRRLLVQRAEAARAVELRVTR